MDSIKKLADLFAKFPNIGSRTAKRFVDYLLTLPKEKVEELSRAIIELKSKIKFCSFCFNYYESDGNLCSICRDLARNKQILCVVEKEADLTSIENTKKYKGLYFILGGVFNFRKDNTGQIRVSDLKERIKNPKKFGAEADFQEIVIAINPTPEGRATAVLVEKALKELILPDVKITHLAKGLPFGGELEYADQETLESAFEGRR